MAIAGIVGVAGLLAEGIVGAAPLLAEGIAGVESLLAEGIIGVAGLLVEGITGVVLENGREGTVDDVADPTLLLDLLCRLGSGTEGLGRGIGFGVAEGRVDEGACFSVLTAGRLGRPGPTDDVEAFPVSLGLGFEGIVGWSELWVISGDEGGEGEKRDATAGGVRGREGGAEFIPCGQNSIRTVAEGDCTGCTFLIDSLFFGTLLVDALLLSC